VGSFDAFCDGNSKNCFLAVCRVFETGYTSRICNKDTIATAQSTLLSFEILHYRAVELRGFKVVKVGGWLTRLERTLQER
jgi:hypothetical protein